jgi:hypothetical protein
LQRNTAFRGLSEAISAPDNRARCSSLVFLIGLGSLARSVAVFRPLLSCSARRSLFQVERVRNVFRFAPRAECSSSVSVATPTCPSFPSCGTERLAFLCVWYLQVWRSCCCYGAWIVCGFVRTSFSAFVRARGDLRNFFFGECSFRVKRNADLCERVGRGEVVGKVQRTRWLGL